MDKKADKNMVKKVMTFKSGQFVFSGKLPIYELLETIAEIRILNETIVSLPILPQASSRLNEELIRKSIFGTAAIEGNPSTEEAIEKMLSGEAGTKKIKQAEREILNLKAAYEYVNTIAPEGPAFELTEELIKKLHCMITKGIEHEHNVPGQYRSNLVKVGDDEHGGVYTPPKILEDVKKLMQEFVVWINSEEVIDTMPPVRAALAHYHLGLIHPFADGNGRTARLVEAIILRSAGVKYAPAMLSNFYYRNIGEYFWAFSLARKNKAHDVSPFVKFVLRGLVESLKEIMGIIAVLIRTLALHTFYDYIRKERDITKRQHDLLILLLGNLKPFKMVDLLETAPFNILYGDVSERTARRDLKKLVEKKALNSLDGGKYELNLNALD